MQPPQATLPAAALLSYTPERNTLINTLGEDSGERNTVVW